MALRQTSDSDLHHRLARMESSSNSPAAMESLFAGSGSGIRTASHSRLISEAMHAAPKPLSILTTDTLGEQVFNMPSSAATPPNEAP